MRRLCSLGINIFLYKLGFCLVTLHPQLNISKRYSQHYSYFTRNLLLYYLITLRYIVLSIVFWNTHLKSPSIPISLNRISIEINHSKLEMNKQQNRIDVSVLRFTYDDIASDFRFYNQNGCLDKNIQAPDVNFDDWFESKFFFRDNCVYWIVVID